MIRLRGGSGLGDSIYLRPIVDHLVARGDQVIALSDYPDVFLGSGAEVEKFGKTNCKVAHYAGRRDRQETNQFQDMCLHACLPEIEFRMEWAIRNQWLIDALREKAAGKPLILAHGGRTPWGRVDGYGMELLPTQAAFDAVCEALADCFIVGIGKAPQLYPVKVGLSLHGDTTVADLLDLGASCDGVIAQCSFAAPLAEIFDKPFLGIWSAVGLASRDPIVRTVTPAKVLSKPGSRYVVDDWSVDRIREAARAFRPV